MIRYERVNQVQEVPVEVKISQGVSQEKLFNDLSHGETIKFVVTKTGDIILGERLHHVIMKDNGLEDEDVNIEGQFAFQEGDILFAYPDVRIRKINIEEIIDDFLKKNKFLFKKSYLNPIYNLQ